MVEVGHVRQFVPVEQDCSPGPSGSPGQVDQAKRVLEMEAQAILAIRDRLSPEFDRAIDLLLGCTGKIAATFASTGTPAFFVHPAELHHGDFGMLAEGDLVVALSGSGETQEIKLALDPLKRLGIP